MSTSVEHERHKLSGKAGLIKVLLVEDNLPDATFVEELLSPRSYSLVQAASLKAAREQCKQVDFNVILLDLSLPDSRGLETFISVLSLVPDVPIVILTGLSDQKLATEAIKMGAQDFVQKTNLNEEALTRIIRYSIERNKSEAALRESAANAIATAAYLKLALRSSHTGVWSWDRATGKVHFDDQMVSMFGLTEDTAGDTIAAFLSRVHPEDQVRIASAFKTAVSLKQEFDVDFRVAWLNAAVHDLSATGQMDCDDTGEVTRMTGVCRDVSKHKTAEKDAKRLVILEKHEDFIATLTHDLKNPLIGADRILELFVTGKLGPLKDEQLKLLRMLRESNDDMLGLIKNLLGVYRYDEGTTLLTYVSVDLSSLTMACLRQLDAIAERAGIKLMSNFPEGLPSVNADSIALSRVLRNLLSNAMKFTPSGGSITISGNIVKDFYVLTVEDTGSGMSEEDASLMFQRYSQGAEGKNYGSGSGLGLYLCRQLVEAHGGTIKCASRLGIGTIFTVTIPL